MVRELDASASGKAGRAPQYDSPGEEYAAAVLALARQIPAGRAMSYGLIAEVVAETLHRGGPRQVGQVMAGLADRYVHLIPDDDSPVIGPAQDNFDVPWWRVIYANGAPPAQYASAAQDAWRREGTPTVANGQRVNLAEAVWFPGLSNDQAPL